MATKTPIVQPIIIIPDESEQPPSTTCYKLVPWMTNCYLEDQTVSQVLEYDVN
jgi:hypothetical protein